MATILDLLGPADTTTSLPSYSGGQWSNQTLDLTKGYYDPWQNYHQGVKLPDGKLWFANPTSQRIGTADTKYGFANQVGTPFAGVTSGANDPNKTTQANLDFINQYVKQGVTNEGQSGFAVDPEAVPYLSFKGNLVQTDRDNTKYAEKKKGGLLGSLGTLAGIAAMFVPGLQPFAAGLNIAGGLQSGNIGQALGGALGLPGVSNAIGGTLGKVVSSAGVPASAVPYVSKGLLSAGVTGLAGGDMKQALTNGLASGVGAYGGNQVSQALGTQFDPAVTRGLSQATAGLLGTAIKGGDVGMGGLLSGINGFSQGAGYGGAGQALTTYIKQQQQKAALQKALQQRMAMQRSQQPARVV